MKNFKLIIFVTVILAGLAAVLLYSRNNQAKPEQELGVQTQATLLGKSEVVIGLDDAFPPIGFRDDKGQLVGFDIDLATAAFGRIGLKPVFKPVAWDGVILTLMDKDIDVIWNGMTITAARQQQISFSSPYLNGSDDFIVRNNSGITKPDDLQGKIVGVQTGSTQESELRDSALGSKLGALRSYASNDEAFLDLKSGRLDALLIDNFAGRYYLTNINKDGNLYSVISGGFGTNQAGVGIRKEDTALKTAIDQALEQMKADGTAKTISQKWFGADLIAY
jgi:polar amino acid transport system substrate-binding protein